MPGAPESVPSPGGVSTVELAVGGMHCESCSALIEETLSAAPHIRRVAVDLEAGRASVDFEPGRTGPEEICAAVAALGYTAAPLGADQTGP